MRSLFLIVVFMVASSSVAEVTTIKGQDATNVCDALRSIYALQTSSLSTFPLARVVQLKKEQLGVHEYIIGGSDERISCISSVYYRPGSHNLEEVVRILYNGEVSSFDKDRTISNWVVHKAYEIYGALAQVICAQFEEFNAVEEQAGLEPQDQVFFTEETSEPNIFGVTSTVVIEQALTCGHRDGEVVLQIPSQDIF